MDATPLSPPPTNRNNPVDVGPEPYRVHIPTRYLELTQQKFADARLPAGDDSLRSDLDSLIDHWHETFSWRHHEHSLNTHPQYRLSIPVAPFGPLRHHFLHHRTPAKRAPPLLLLSEHWDHVPLFTELAQRNICDIVLPSAPGCGFSDAPESAKNDDGDNGSGSGGTTLEAGSYTLHHVASGFHALMQRLGYERYVIACSGVFGFTLARLMSRTYPGILGVHSCFLPTLKPTGWWGRLRTKRWGLRRREGVRDDGVVLNMGATERQAWEYAVTDSPMGLLAWVVGRVREGGGRYKWTQTQLLGAFMYYWISGPRGFFRMMEEEEVKKACGTRSEVPLGLLVGTETEMKRGYVADCLGPVVSWEQRTEAVGRWVAFEQPQMVADSLIRFWETVIR
ncbi:Similar to Putative epoxide hydrolase; acc. no. Q06816 [Pyronema omphalodes CBS 100304]|uniref:Similar to Putative epoxide hydrolase acc. no. Q06816 n=1 Tax=Pyronema omphalodes (strain CBS 100304) TaxID=1076935 RepID=U4L260_PYROM|nr:Similar to Putative epoxide hydrolase; acc. no. Q06816 [Pyronema omphalodes CBS 100304]